MDSPLAATAGRSPLSAEEQEPDWNSAMSMFSNAPIDPQNPVDNFRRAYTSMRSPVDNGPEFDKLEGAASDYADRARAETERLRNFPLDDRIPNYRFAAGIMKPATSLGAAVGEGFGEYGEGLSDLQQQRQKLAQATAELAVKGTEENVFKNKAQIVQQRVADRRADAMVQRYAMQSMMTPEVKDWMVGHGIGLDQLMSGQITPDQRKELNDFLHMKFGTRETKNAYFATNASGNPAQDAVQRHLIMAPILNQLRTQANSIFKDAVFPGGPAAKQQAVDDWVTQHAAAFNIDPKEDTFDPNNPAHVAALAAVAPKVDPLTGALQKGSPALEGAQETSKMSAKDEQEYKVGLMEQKANLATQDAQLNELKDAISNTTAGLLGAPAYLKNRVKAALGLASDEDIKSAAGYEEANKIRGGIATTTTKTLSARPSQLEFIKMLDEFTPNTTMTPAGSERMINMMHFVNNLASQKADEYFKWKSAHPDPNEKGGAGDFTRFENDYANRARSLYNGLHTLHQASFEALPPTDLPIDAQFAGVNKDGQQGWKFPDGNVHVFDKKGQFVGIGGGKSK